jgi:hypothetical protein
LKKPVAALFIAVSSLAVVSSPAGAAVPKSKPDQTLVCGKKTAQLWMDDTHVAAKNSCKKEWLIIEHWTASQSDPGPMTDSVAPGAHFNIRLSWNDIGEVTHIRLASKAACDVDGNLYLKNSHGKASYC